MKLTTRGQGIMETLISIPVIIIGLVVFFLIFGSVGETLLETLDAANSDLIANVAAIKVIISVIGFIVVAMVIMRIINSFRQPGYPPQSGFG